MTNKNNNESCRVKAVESARRPVVHPKPNEGTQTCNLMCFSYHYSHRISCYRQTKVTADREPIIKCFAGCNVLTIIARCGYKPAAIQYKLCSNALSIAVSMFPPPLRDSLCVCCMLAFDMSKLHGPLICWDNYFGSLSSM